MLGISSLLSKRSAHWAMCHHALSLSTRTRSAFPASVYDINLLYALVYTPVHRRDLPGFGDGIIRDLFTRDYSTQFNNDEQGDRLRGNMLMLAMLANDSAAAQRGRVTELVRCFQEGLAEFSGAAAAYKDVGEASKVQKIAGLKWLETRMVAQWSLPCKETNRSVALSKLLGEDSPAHKHASALALNLTLPEKCDFLRRKTDSPALSPLSETQQFVTSLNALSLIPKNDALLLESVDAQPFDALLLSRWTMDYKPLLVFLDFKQDAGLANESYAELHQAVLETRRLAQQKELPLSEVGQAFADARFVFATMSCAAKKKERSDAFDLAHREFVDADKFFGPMMQLYRTIM